MNDKYDKVNLRWLILGAAAGLLAAAYGILRQASVGDRLPESAVARVNDSFVSRDIFDRALSRLPAGEDSAKLLQDLIDEELLVQRGIELGMTESDREIRTAIATSLIASITAEADAASPSDEELEQHLADNAERFSYVSKISVAAWQADDEDVAQNHLAKIRGDGTAAVDESLHQLPDLPTGLMPVDVLAGFVGPGIAAAAGEMPVGSSAVFARRGRWLVVLVLDKETTNVTELATIRTRVLLDYRRTLATELLANYLEDLRRRADIVVASP